MNEVVMDASAILTVIQHERGAERLTAALLKDAVIGTVNLAEVHSNLVKNGYPSEEAWDDALELVAAVKPYTLEHARIAGDLITKTEKYGLSLGDRACLALAIALKAEVYTTEKIWKDLRIGVRIHIIR